MYNNTWERGTRRQGACVWGGSEYSQRVGEDVVNELGSPPLGGMSTGNEFRPLASSFPPRFYSPRIAPPTFFDAALPPSKPVNTTESAPVNSAANVICEDSRRNLPFPLSAGSRAAKIARWHRRRAAAGAWRAAHGRGGRRPAGVRPRTANVGVLGQ